MTTTPRRGLGRPLLVGAGLLALVAVLVLAGLAATADGAARCPWVSTATNERPASSGVRGAAGWSRAGAGRRRAAP